VTRLFYDGSCGYCHGMARFVARRERTGAIRFAPLGGETFADLISLDRQRSLPDSLVVLTAGNELLVRSAAVLHLLQRMGPAWRFWGQVLTWIPGFIRDAAYDLIARHRPTRLACPREDQPRDERFDP